MKLIKLIITVFVMFSSQAVFAESLSDSLDFPFGKEDKLAKNNEKSIEEPQTLINMDDFQISVFGGPWLTYGKMNDENMVMVGGRGAFLLSDSFFVGIGGMGMASPYSRSVFTGETYRGKYDTVQFGYGGAYLGVNFFPKSILSLSLSTLIGTGELAYCEGFEDCDDDSDQRDYDEKVDKSSLNEFFVVEPMLLLHMNVTDWFRIGGGISYRYTKGIDSGTVNDEDMRDFSAVFTADFVLW